MTWLSTPLPARLALGIQCKPGWLTSVAAASSGIERRTQIWEDVRHSYELGWTIRPEADFRLLRDHFTMARGRAHIWPLKDPLDYRVEQSEGVVAVTPDNSPAGKQLYKRYGSGSLAYDRRISRPKQGTILVFESGTLRTEGVHYTIDYDRGEIYTSISVGALSWSGQFWTPCRYDTDELPAVAADRQPNSGQLLIEVGGVPVVEDRDEDGNA